MRIAYVGLSTPFFYDYATQTPQTRSNKFSSPNPVLESPFGLLLLYDEIWFITRSLCPKNMRKLPYVHFLDEEQMLPEIEDIAFPRLDDLIAENEILAKNYYTVREQLNEEFLRQNISITWKVRPDHHTHPLQIGNVQTWATPLDPTLLAWDMEVVRRIGNSDIELITNSISQNWLEQHDNQVARVQLTEQLVIHNIPNYLRRNGPYHPSIEEVREDRFLKDFRKWVVQESRRATDREVKQITHDIEERLQQAQDEVFLKQFSAREHFTSVGKTLMGTAVDIIAPGASTLASLGEEIKKYAENRNNRWQAFIVSARRTLRS